MKKIFIILAALLWQSSSAVASDARKIIQKVLDCDDGTTEIARVALSTCPVKKQGKKIICSSHPRVKVMDMIRKDYGPDEKDHKTIIIVQEPAGERGIGFLQYDYEKKGKKRINGFICLRLGKLSELFPAAKMNPKPAIFSVLNSIMKIWKKDTLMSILISFWVKRSIAGNPVL